MKTQVAFQFVLDDRGLGLKRRSLILIPTHIYRAAAGKNVGGDLDARYRRTGWRSSAADLLQARSATSPPIPFAQHRWRAVGVCK